MNVKTAVEILKKHDTLENQNKDSDFEVYCSVSNQQAQAIADFIEQQAQQIQAMEEQIKKAAITCD